jgi:hypothetical protein
MLTVLSVQSIPCAHLSNEVADQELPEVFTG